LRRFREAVGASTITVGPVSVMLGQPDLPRAEARIVSGHIATSGAS
jgi:hypothetical protein